MPILPGWFDYLTSELMGSGESQEKGLIVQDKIARNGTAENLSCLPTFEN